MCGAAPVTKAPCSPATSPSYTGNKPARVAITTSADNSRHCSAWAADTYRRARARGARHPHATRILARGWVRVIWAAWTLRHPSRHRGEMRLLTAGRERRISRRNCHATVTNRTGPVSMQFRAP